MITNASLEQIFGQGATQNADSLTFLVNFLATGESALATIIARLNSYSDFRLQTENGSVLTTEQGTKLTADIVFQLIEFEKMPTRFRSQQRIDRFFIGLNTPYP